MPVGVLSSDSAENEGESGLAFSPKDALSRIAPPNLAARLMTDLLCLSSFIPKYSTRNRETNNHLTAFQLGMSICSSFLPAS